MPIISAAPNPPEIPLAETIPRAHRLSDKEDTATVVTMDEHNFRSGSVPLVFPDDGELATSRDAATLDRLVGVVGAAERSPAGRRPGIPRLDTTHAPTFEESS